MDLQIPSVANCNPIPTPINVGNIVEQIAIAFKIFITISSMIFLQIINNKYFKTTYKYNYLQKYYITNKFKYIDY
ncbi:hypothetical protein EBI_25440 [Enterocytozoon bieneusi H348]|nr:hypothetical protein EBI_25440 [Enterocytozoon bieneusi H348]|eukprot:XP_002650240.1 hypothetical protein EBI_25440 [Enterocytozoon bieneusi H348]